ncbi:MAG: amidinotransferase [Nitrospirae bacterium]|nr:amidinotransferase [Nitrospirota bacterium]
MCRPAYFSVEYEINPWMSLQNRPDPEVARTQWDQTVRTLLSLGCEITYIEPAKDQPDMVFTANSGLAFDGRVILGRFRHKERQGEETFHENWFRSQGYQIHRLPEGTCFEGEGDATFYKDRVLMGYGFRTDLTVHPRVSEILRKPVVSLELTDPRFYHLDTCLVYLPAADLILFHPQAFTSRSIETIHRLPSRIVEAGEEDARLFACNSVPIGTSLVLNRCTRSLQQKLESCGIQTHFAETSEFLKAGGSVRCMVLHLS